MYTMGISLPLKNVHVLMRKALNKTKTNIFSTVGPWGLFRPFLLLRARKQTSGGSQVPCAVSEKSLWHTWGLRFRLHRKSESLSSHSHSNHIPQHEYRTTASFILWLHAQPWPPGSWVPGDGPMPCTQVWKLTTVHKTTTNKRFTRILDNLLEGGAGQRRGVKQFL